MPTKKVVNRRSGAHEGGPVLVADWVKPFPDYVEYLHRAAIDQHAADQYAGGHIAGFKVVDQDRAICPSLEDITMVYLVYKERPNGDPRNL